jgi:hypothetical protein
MLGDATKWTIVFAIRRRLWRSWCSICFVKRGDRLDSWSVERACKVLSNREGVASETDPNESGPEYEDRACRNRFRIVELVRLLGVGTYLPVQLVRIFVLFEQIW